MHTAYPCILFGVIFKFSKIKMNKEFIVGWLFVFFCDDNVFCIFINLKTNRVLGKVEQHKLYYVPIRIWKFIFFINSIHRQYSYYQCQPMKGPEAVFSVENSFKNSVFKQDGETTISGDAEHLCNFKGTVNVEISYITLFSK